MKKRIALLAGGNSSEFGISLKSGQQVAQHLDPSLFEVFLILVKGPEWSWEDENGQKFLIDRNDFSLTLDREKILFDCAFIAIHGTPGEDGILQAYFDLLGIPYTGSGRLTSAITFHKYFCKKYLESLGVLSSPSILVRKEEAEIGERIEKGPGFPCFVKPVEGGSSFGVSMVKNRDDLQKALDHAFSEDTEVLVESLIRGREITCGLVKGKERSMIFPLTEIVSKNEFFDYEAKYITGRSDEITPARISPGLTAKCQALSSDIYDYLQCRGVVRIDYILRESDFYFLEVNTIPGMTAESIVPKMAEAYGITLKEFYTFLIEETIGS